MKFPIGRYTKKLQFVPIYKTKNASKPLHLISSHKTYQLKNIYNFVTFNVCNMI